MNFCKFLDVFKTFSQFSQHLKFKHLEYCNFPDNFRTNYRQKNPTKTGQFSDRFLTNSCCPEYCKIPDNPFFVQKNFSQKPDIFFL